MRTSKLKGQIRLHLRQRFFFSFLAFNTWKEEKGFVVLFSAHRLITNHLSIICLYMVVDAWFAQGVRHARLSLFKHKCARVWKRDETVHDYWCYVVCCSCRQRSTLMESNHVVSGSRRGCCSDPVRGNQSCSGERKLAPEVPLESFTSGYTAAALPCCPTIPSNESSSGADTPKLSCAFETILYFQPIDHPKQLNVIRFTCHTAGFGPSYHSASK